jgi:hypothetical protein
MYFYAEPREYTCLKYIFSHNEVQHDGVVDTQTWNDNHTKHDVFLKGASNDLEDSSLCTKNIYAIHGDDHGHGAVDHACLCFGVDGGGE